MSHKKLLFLDRYQYTNSVLAVLTFEV